LQVSLAEQVGEEHYVGTR